MLTGSVRSSRNYLVRRSIASARSSQPATSLRGPSQLPIRRRGVEQLGDARPAVASIAIASQQRCSVGALLVQAPPSSAFLRMQRWMQVPAAPPTSSRAASSTSGAAAVEGRAELSKIVAAEVATASSSISSSSSSRRSSRRQGSNSGCSSSAGGQGSSPRQSRSIASKTSPSATAGGEGVGSGDGKSAKVQTRSASTGAVINISIDQWKRSARKLTLKIAHKLWEGSKRLIRKTGSLTWAFIKNPRIICEWYEDIRDAVVHFVQWVVTGFKLFGADVRASFFLIKRVVRGYPLKLRERNLLVRTTSDCLKLIPFSFFLIVPFAELALPVVLRVFPNMLPSTFFQQKYDNATLARKFKAKEEIAEFWQQVVHKRTQEILDSDDHRFADKAEELAEFQEKLLEGTEYPTLKEILRFSKLFQEELSLKNMSDKQMSALSRMLGLPQTRSWWPGHLEVQLRHHITQLRREDRDYMWEGVDGLTHAELVEACKKRAICFHDVSEEEMKRDLRRWLELSSNQQRIPTALLLWIQSFYLRGVVPVSEQAFSELKMDVKSPDEKIESPPDEAFLGMAERQKAYAQSAEQRLEELKKEVEGVMENCAREEAGEKPNEEARHMEEEEEEEAGGCILEEERRAKKQTLERVQKLDQTLQFYKKVVDRQKSMLDQQLKFLRMMKDNRPTKQKDADVILLDQQVRLMEMVGAFENNMEQIEALLSEADPSQGNGSGPTANWAWPPSDRRPTALGAAMSAAAPGGTAVGGQAASSGPASWSDLDASAALGSVSSGKASGSDRGQQRVS